MMNETKAVIVYCKVITTTCGGVALHYKDHLHVVIRNDTSFLNENIVLETLNVPLPLMFIALSKQESTF